MVDLLEEIERRKKVIEDEIDTLFVGEEKNDLWNLMEWYPKGDGKKLRPFLAMITAGAMGEKEEKAVPLGVAVELIHNFTLVHDDIMDDDDIRRGKKTLHRKEGLPSAINAGDALFALSFKVLSRTEIERGGMRDLLEEISTSVIKVAEGQEEDMRFEETFDISESEFINMIEKKTSYLFRACARGGAIIAEGEDHEIKKMGEYARNMGIAFQIQDDLLDLVGDQKEIGKPVGSDIRRGKRTLIIINALENLSGQKCERLKEILRSENTDEEVKEALDLLEESDSLSYCRELAEKYAAKSKENLEFLPESRYKKILNSLVDFMIQREV